MKPAVLFISSRDPKTTTVKDGGVSLTSSNLRSLESFCSVSVDTVFPEKEGLGPKAFRFFLCFFGFSGGLTPWKKDKILQRIKVEKFDAVFIDSSLYGRLCGDIKKITPQTLVICHFHNIEQKYPLESKSAPFFTRWALANSAELNERAAVKYADHLICLSPIDSQELERLYGKPATLILPISMSSAGQLETTASPHQPLSLLFCGSHFAPNIEGLKWFIQNVLPKMNCKLHIVGYGMEKLNFAHPNVINHGAVQDVSDYYQTADAVVSPILSGSGMKTKTIEALKYGKAVFGSSEAWRGLARPAGLPLYLCNSPQEYQETLTTHFNTHNKIFYPTVRDYFEKEFSEKIKISRLEKILTQMKD